MPPQHIELAEADRQQTGRLLGFEMARLGLSLPADAQHELKEGFQEGQYAGARNRKGATAYERKLLRLKVSAWRRGRIVDEAVTADFLEKIMVKYCPVKRCELTSGTGTGTDATMDRVFNGGAYAVGNIACMSAAANHAKGSLLPLEIVEIATAGRDLDGLNAVEWMRMACLVCQATPPGYPVTNLPMFVYPPNGLLISNAYVVVQQGITTLAAGILRPTWTSEFRSACKGKRAKKALDQLLHTLASMVRRTMVGAATDEQRRFAMCDAWIAPLVFEQYISLVKELDVEETQTLMATARRAVGGFKDMSSGQIDTWSISTGGYR